MSTGTLFVVGNTGSGKSSVLNCFLGVEHFATSELPTPCTKDPESFSNTINGRRLIAIDSEGFNDGQNNHEIQTRKLGNFLRNCMTGVNAIAVVQPYTMCRFAQGVMDEIKFLYDTFKTNDILSHFCIIFTFCPSNCDRNLKQTMYNNEAKEFLKEISGATNVPDIPMFFIETRKMHKPDMAEELERLRNFVLSKSVLLTKEVYDALYGFKEETERQNRVYQGIRKDGNKKYETYIDRVRTVKIPNNGNPRQYSNWRTTRSYEELLEEEKTEWKYHVYNGYEYSGDTRYKVYYDQYRTVIYNHKLNKNTYESGWTSTNKKREYNASRSFVRYEYKTKREFDHTTKYNNVYRISKLKREVTRDFDGSLSYGNWWEYDHEYEYEQRPVVEHVTYESDDDFCYIA